MNDQNTNMNMNQGMEHKHIEKMGDKKVCNCPHHKVVPWMIVLIGVVIILGAIGLGYLWESVFAGVFLIVIGGTKLNSRKCGCCEKQ